LVFFLHAKIILQPTRDPEAGWHVKADSRGTLKSTYGYSVHTGVDEDSFNRPLF
jgi:hypothetical protein